MLRGKKRRIIRWFFTQLVFEPHSKHNLFLLPFLPPHCTPAEWPHASGTLTPRDGGRASVTQSPPPDGCRQPRWPRRERAAAAGYAACSVNKVWRDRVEGGWGQVCRGTAEPAGAAALQLAGWQVGERRPAGWGWGRAEQWNGAGQGCRGRGSCPGRGSAPFPFHRKPRHSPHLL